MSAYPSLKRLETAGVLAAIRRLLNHATVSLAIAAAFTVWIGLHSLLESNIAERIDGQ